MSLDKKLLLKGGLVPEHKILTKEEISELLSNFGLSISDLPVIKEDDPVITAIGGKEGQVVQITRALPSGKTYPYYRVIVK